MHFGGWMRPMRKGGIERCFAAYYATSRDYARFGKLINHQGNWNGKQLIDSTYMAEMLTPIAAMSDEMRCGNITAIKSGWAKPTSGMPIQLHGRIARTNGHFCASIGLGRGANGLQKGQTEKKVLCRRISDVFSIWPSVCWSNDGLKTNCKIHNCRV